MKFLISLYAFTLVAGANVIRLRQPDSMDARAVAGLNDYSREATDYSKRYDGDYSKRAEEEVASDYSKRIDGDYSKRAQEDAGSDYSKRAQEETSSDYSKRVQGDYSK